MQHLHKEHRALFNKNNARRRGFKSSSTEDDNENQQGPLGNEFTEVIRLKKEEGKIVYGEQREDGVRKISNPYCLFLVEGFVYRFCLVFVAISLFVMHEVLQGKTKVPTAHVVGTPPRQALQL